MPLPDSLEAVVRDRLARLGLFDRAYVKAVVRRGRTLYVAYGADGTKLWQFRSRALADAAMSQQDLRALSVH